MFCLQFQAEDGTSRPSLHHQGEWSLDKVFCEALPSVHCSSCWSPFTRVYKSLQSCRLPLFTLVNYCGKLLYMSSVHCLNGLVQSLTLLCFTCADYSRHSVFSGAESEVIFVALDGLAV